MPERYYNNPNDASRYPDVVYIILERLQAYFCNMFYSSEDFTTSKKRFIIADFSGGDEVSIRRAIETFPANGSSSTFPFTAYNIDEDEDIDYSSFLHKNNSYYCEDIGSYVSAITFTLNIPMSTFFNTPYDYRRALMLLQNDRATLTRLWCPCTLFEQVFQFPIDVSFAPTKGSYAFAFEQHLQTGKIFNIQHDCTVKYQMFLLNQKSTADSTGHQIPAPVYPVDDIIVALRDMSNKVLFDSKMIPTTPVVLSTAPVEGEEDFDIDAPLIFTFNQSMDETSVVNSLDIVPMMDYKLVWNSTSTQMVIDPKGSLPLDTYYTILLNNNATSMTGVNLKEDFTLHFRTEVV